MATSQQELFIPPTFPLLTPSQATPPLMYLPSLVMQGNRWISEQSTIRLIPGRKSKTDFFIHVVMSFMCWKTWVKLAIFQGKFPHVFILFPASLHFNNSSCVSF